MSQIVRLAVKFVSPTIVKFLQDPEKSTQAACKPGYALPDGSTETLLVCEGGSWRDRNSAEGIPDCQVFAIVVVVLLGFSWFLVGFHAFGWFGWISCFCWFFMVFGWFS